MKMSDGQLRVRIRAYKREKPWAPPWVANELAGTRQAAATHRNNAARRAAEAQAATDPQTRDRLHQEAADAAALADILDVRAAEVAQVGRLRRIPTEALATYTARLIVEQHAA